MKNVKLFFILSLIGCIILPVLILLVVALSIFFEMEFATLIYDWIILNGGAYVLVSYQVIIILIALSLGLTLKLKDASSLTTEQVVKQLSKKTSKVKKVVADLPIQIKNVESIKKNIKSLERSSVELLAEAKQEVAKEVIKKVKTTVYDSTAETTAPKSSEKKTEKKIPFKSVK